MTQPTEQIARERAEKIAAAVDARLHDGASTARTKIIAGIIEPQIKAIRREALLAAVSKAENSATAYEAMLAIRSLIDGGE